MYNFQILNFFCLISLENGSLSVSFREKDKKSNKNNLTDLELTMLIGIIPDFFPQYMKFRKSCKT